MTVPLPVTGGSIAESERIVKVCRGHGRIGLKTTNGLLSICGALLCAVTPLRVEADIVPVARAIAHWRHYEQWLAPMKEELGFVLDLYPVPPRFFPRVSARIAPRPLGTPRFYRSLNGARQFGLAVNLGGAEGARSSLIPLPAGNKG